MNENIWLEPIVNKYKLFFGDNAPIIFDVGSRDGHDAEYLKEKLNGETIYAIDANPLAIENIKQNYPNFNIIETAVSDYDGQTSFDQLLSDSEDIAGSSSIKECWHFEDVTVNTIEVPVTRMDTLLSDLKLQDTLIDVMKVDVEGFSYECVVGLGGYAKNIKLLHLETETFERHEGHKNNNRIIDLMLNLGFVLCDTSYQWGEHIQDQIWVNPTHFRK